MQKLAFQTKHMTQGQLKTQICMQKSLKFGRLLFLIIFVCSNFLPLNSIQIVKTLFDKIVNCHKKSNRYILVKTCSNTVLI